MNKKATAIFLALLVAVMPHLGFPGDIEKIFYTAVGILIAVLVQFSSFRYCSVCDEIIEEKHARGAHDDVIEDEVVEEPDGSHEEVSEEKKDALSAEETEEEEDIFDPFKK